MIIERFDSLRAARGIGIGLMFGVITWLAIVWGGIIAVVTWAAP